MDNSRKLIVGYDLCEDYSQLCCYSYKTYEPIPIGTSEEEDSMMIPTALCVKNDSRIWLYGKEAISCGKEGLGVLVDNILEKINNKEEVEIFGERYSGVELLEKYLRKTLTLIKDYFPTETITKIVVTIDKMDQRLVDGVYDALFMLGIEKDRATVMSHGSSFMYYALSQAKELWLNDVGLFDFNEEGLSFYQISINRRQKPMIADMEKEDLSDTLNLDLVKDNKVDIKYTFENLANTVLYKKIITTLYFTGKGFKGNWAEDIFKSLCAGRRVFVGQNLYVKGACYAAKEFSGDGNLDNVILLDNDMIVCSVSIRAYVDGNIQEVLLTDAAVPWYEVNREVEVIPDDTTDMEIIFRNIMTKEIVRERITLNPIPDRSSRMTRLKLSLSCVDRNRAHIVINDLGFGDIYQASGKIAEYIMEMIE
ncbi:MAG: hypothetical protein GX237_05810 [Clostridiales bacterium]|nr:hypothetical protein [Clostridiales bacterium]